MLGERDPFDYMLAEALGWRSVAAMRAGMGNGEYIEWRAYHTWRNAQAELAREQAE
jgi:hypothetical protein